MRIDVAKFLFVGSEKDRIAFFKEAQDLGIIHFIEGTSVKQQEAPLEVQNVAYAIKVLRGLPPTEQEEIEGFEIADSITQAIIDLKHKQENLLEQERLLKLEIERVGIFGNFSLEDVDFIEKEGHRAVQFFCAKRGHFEEEGLPEGFIYIDSDHGLDYFIAINPEPVQVERMIEMKIDQPLGTLKEKLERVRSEEQKVFTALKGYEKYNTFLHHAYMHKLNIANLEIAQSSTQPILDDTLFTIQGWVPKNRVEQMESLIDDFHVYAEEIAVNEEETIPTYLENKGMHRIGEDLVHIYDTPSHTDNDPSLWVLFAFSLFFAMIVGDGGYGLIFLVVSLWLRYKFYGNARRVGRRVLNLFAILSVFCIGWGVLTNSFFGIDFGIDSPVRKFSLVQWLVEKKAEYHWAHKDGTYEEWVKEYPQLKDMTSGKEIAANAVTFPKDTGVENAKYVLVDKFADNIMMELALLIGVIHVILSQLRYLMRNWAHAGWILFIIGCYLYFPVYLDATSLIHYVFGVDMASGGVNGLYLIYGGIGLAVVLSLIQNKLGGLVEIMNVIQIFADILSYLRLYALGLAGAIVSATINDIAGSLFVVFGVLLVIIGHAVNILLAVMGGVIHGLRLNFLEWYHYSFEGGGKMFRPLKKLPTD